MLYWIVTVKLVKFNPLHDPKDKKRGVCPIFGKGYCSDVTGQHHSFLVEAESEEEIRKRYFGITSIENGQQFNWITRIERTEIHVGL